MKHSKQLMEGVAYDGMMWLLIDLNRVWSGRYTFSYIDFKASVQIQVHRFMHGPFVLSNTTVYLRFTHRRRQYLHQRSLDPALGAIKAPLSEIKLSLKLLNIHSLLHFLH